MPACPASFLKKDSRSRKLSGGMTNYVVLLMNFLITLSTAKEDKTLRNLTKQGVFFRLKVKFIISIEALAKVSKKAFLS